jgi:hypothetical protein
MSSKQRAWPALAACLLLLALPASAGAAYGPHGAVYGGKISTNQGGQAQHPFSLALTANGKRIKAFVIYWHTKPCTGSGIDYAGGLTAASTRLLPSGAFSDVVSFSEPNPDDATQKLNHRVTLQGHAGRRSASGTYRDVIAITNAAGVTVSTCDTGTVNWSARRGKRNYGGQTDQKWPLSLRLNRSARKLASFFIQWRADCGGGTSLERTLNHSGVKVNKRGRFSKSGSLSFTTDKGAKVTGTFSLSGRFSRRRVTGRYTVHAIGTATNGQQFNCTLDRLRYSAERG